MRQALTHTDKAVIVLALLAVSACGIAGAATERWVLTAMPVGFLFGFFLQKGDLCGASAMSEVLAFRDGRKLFGLWVAIVVGMLGFALGDGLGLITLTPKPMLWALYVLGGVVFGAGTVLAGGCVSGCLYKAAAGNMSSVVALLAMPAGIAAVEYGPLEPLFNAGKPLVIPGPDGKALDLPSVLHLPFAVLAVLFAAGTAGAVFWRRRRLAPAPAPAGSWATRFLFRPWRPWQAGLAIGLLALPGFMSSAASGRNYPLGVTHGVLQAQVLLTEATVVHVTSKPAPRATKAPGDAVAQPAAPAPASGKKVVWWLVLVVLAVLLGSNVSARLSGQLRLLPKPPDETLVAILGGFLVGAGAAFATGCVVGNIMSGWALMSVGMLLFGVATLFGNWVTTFFYLMGGDLRRR